MTSQFAKENVSRVLAVFVCLVGVHSVILGVVLIVAPFWLLSLFGWAISCHPFFLQQAGVFHILLGLFYVVEYFSYHRIRMLLTAKVSAVIFLSARYVWSDPEPGVMLSNLADASMAAIAAFLWTRSTRANNTLRG